MLGALNSGISYADNAVTTRSAVEAILYDDSYIVGMGVGTDLETARSAAISNLISKISVNVQSRFSYVTSETSKGSELTSDEKMDMIMNSYAGATLNNVAEFVDNDKNEYTVYRYMKKSEMHAMFRRRVDMAHKWAVEAATREKEGKIGDALQNYYWALALLRSCPDSDLETVNDNGQETNFMQYLYLKVKDILGDVSVRATSVEMTDDRQRVSLLFDYAGHPMVNFNYKFFDGKDFSEVYTAKNGIGELWIPESYKLGKLKLHAEYECREEANIHPDLEGVMRSTEPVPFAAAVYKVDTKACATVSSSGYGLQLARPLDCPNKETFSGGGGGAIVALTSYGPRTSSTESTGEGSDASKTVSVSEDACLEVMKSVEKALAAHDATGIKDFFTPEGWDMYTRLITYGDARMLKTPEVTFLPDGDGMVCRSIPMSFSFKSNRRTFTEDVVFYFNGDAKIREVAFSLERSAVDDIMRRDDWGVEAREVMIHFLETYKTAYALERLDYISSIFSSDALIITGSVVRSTGKKGMDPASKRHVKYTRQTKEEYIANLKKCFAANEYVNIRFADNIVRRSHTNPDIYGIQIKQDYFSSSYGDTGYLFLMIDFANTNAPLIHVRTWQPDLDPNVKDGRIGMADFML